MIDRTLTSSWRLKNHPLFWREAAWLQISQRLQTGDASGQDPRTMHTRQPCFLRVATDPAAPAHSSPTLSREKKSWTAYTHRVIAVHSISSVLHSSCIVRTHLRIYLPDIFPHEGQHHAQEQRKTPGERILTTMNLHGLKSRCKS